MISFIIGAGFSLPDNYPTRKSLNERLRKISHKEILIHTDGYAMFLNDEEDPNADWTNVQEKFFVEQFIDFYTSSKINKIEDFDYEQFFDYYQGLHLGRSKCEKFNEFADNFRINNAYKVDNTNLLGHFHNTFNQLIANQIMRWPERVHLSKYYTKYPEFLNYIDKIKPNYNKINFHTLNHDLLMEELSISDAMSDGFSDGFDDIGSPFYSKNNERQTVRLRRFTNVFDKKFCLFKLHGSIDQYIYNFKNKEYTAVKVPYGVSTNELMKEYETEDKKLEYDKCWWNYYPDFLSGTTEKINSYSESHYYKPIFDHFINNLRNSKELISIGYGLGDTKINEIIIENFLSDSQKTMIIITPSKPECNLFNFENVKYYGVNLGVQHIRKCLIDNL